THSRLRVAVPSGRGYRKLPDAYPRRSWRGSPPMSRRIWTIIFMARLERVLNFRVLPETDSCRATHMSDPLGSNPGRTGARNATAGLPYYEPWEMLLAVRQHNQYARRKPWLDIFITVAAGSSYDYQEDARPRLHSFVLLLFE